MNRTETTMDITPGALILLLSACLLSFSTLAQAQETPAESEGEESSASQEVEINEDNYRRYMELRDRRIDRSSLPVDAYQSRASLQKLDELPESSQKHLRDQLREIIMQGNQWQPGDELKQYPYVPSSAAQYNTPLQNQESAAWSDMLQEYHQREAQIYSNSARSRAAMANAPGDTRSQGANGTDQSQDNTGRNGGSGQQSDGGGSESFGARGQNAQQSRSAQTTTSAAQNSSAVNDAEKISTDGDSQNALEFLLGQKGGNTGQGAGGGGEAGQRLPSDQQGNAGGLPDLPDLGTGSQAGAGTEKQSASHSSTSSESSGQSGQPSEAAAPMAENSGERRADAGQQANNAQNSRSSGSDDVEYISTGTLSIRELQDAKGISDLPITEPRRETGPRDGIDGSGTLIIPTGETTPAGTTGKSGDKDG